MRDTPRTDAWIKENGDDGLIYVDFALTLERELAERTAYAAAITALLEAARHYVSLAAATHLLDEINAAIARGRG